VTILIVMGVSGSGKTTVAKALAAAEGWPVLEGDSFHPPSNVAKMQTGRPLTDEDRWPWLHATYTVREEKARWSRAPRCGTFIGTF
jgi:gluconokinase